MNLLVLEQLTISDSQKSLIQTKNPRNSHLFFISNETTPQVIYRVRSQVFSLI